MQYAFWMTFPFQSFVHKGWWIRMSHSDPASVPTGGGSKIELQNVNMWQKLCIFVFLFFGEKGNVLFGNAFQISSLPPVTNAKWQQEPLRKFWFRMRLRPRARLSWISFTHCRVVPPGFYWEGYANTQLMIEMRFGNTIIPGNRAK